MMPERGESLLFVSGEDPVPNVCVSESKLEVFQIETPAGRHLELMSTFETRSSAMSVSVPLKDAAEVRRLRDILNGFLETLV